MTQLNENNHKIYQDLEEALGAMDHNTMACTQTLSYAYAK